MAILQDLSIFWAMLHVVVLFIMLFRSRYSKRRTVMIAGIVMGILMIANGIGLILFGVDALAKNFLITCSIPSFLLFYVLSENKRFRFLLTFCLADTVCLWIMAVTNLMDYYLGGGQYVLMFLSRLFIYPLVEYGAWKFIRKPYLELQNSVKSGWGIFSIMTMLYYILLVVVVQYPTNITQRPQDTFLCILVLALMVFNYGTIFVSLYRQLLIYRKQQSERVLQEQKTALESQLENQQRIRKMKHDMKGYTITLSGLLATGRIEEAQIYLKGIEDKMDNFLSVLCANPYINAVLVQYVQKLQEMGAAYRLDIQIGGGEELPYMQLCQILSNGLENVCDAFKQIDTDRRKMSVQMKYRKEYLLIRIRNYCREDLHVEKGSIPATSKKDKDHGFGILTIKEAAESLDGEMFCYTEKGCFLLDVMLHM